MAIGEQPFHLSHCLNFRILLSPLEGKPVLWIINRGDGLSGNLAVWRLHLSTPITLLALGRPNAVFTPSIEAQFTQSISTDVLTLVEAAALLKCCPKTLRKQASAGKVPGKRVGTLWRFYRPILEEWLREAA
jgi:excisionase family DNA binding protein